MSDWQKQSLNLKVGGWIIWRDEAIGTEDGPALVSPGMKGKILSLHDGFHLDVVQGGSIPPKAVVQFEKCWWREDKVGEDVQHRRGQYQVRGE